MDSKSFLGKGLSFPLSVDPKTGKIAMVSHEEDIKQAVGIIIKTYVGERVMRPDFGSRALDYVFESDSQDFSLSVVNEITSALVAWEPRIEDINVSTDMKEGGDRSRAVVTVSYKVRSTNNYFNLVYPFYLQEGVEA
ncbi:MAG: GPW/gp25 family protein [Clostridiales bacterium]|nr:GPW/gp25 family protein [Clostridiales bacterium]